MFGRFKLNRKRRLARRIAIWLLADHKLEKHSSQLTAWHFLHENADLLWTSFSSGRLWLRRIKHNKDLSASDLLMNNINLCHIRDGLLFNDCVESSSFSWRILFLRVYIGFLIFFICAQIANMIFNFI